MATVGGEVAAALGKALARHHITLKQADVLSHIVQQPGRSYAELARSSRVTKQTMQVLVRHLEQLGAVQRVGQAGSGNIARLHVTANGRELLDAVHDSMEQVAEQLTAGMTAHDQATLGVLLTAVGATIRDRPIVGATAVTAY